MAPSTSTRNDVRRIDVLVFDTSGPSTLALRVDGVDIAVLALPPFTPPTRGWPPDRGYRTIDLGLLLATHGFDAHAQGQCVVGGQVVGGTNALMIHSPNRDEFLLAHNDGGIENGDRDANEPIVRCRR